MKRVVVTGMAGVTAFGTTWAQIHDAFRARKNVTQRIQEWDRFTDLGTKLAAPVDHFTPPEHWTRKQLRGMGRVSQLAVRAAEMALERAGLLNDPLLKNGRTGVACGSCVGSTPDIQDFVLMVINGTSPGLSANSYVRMMPHTAAANISMFFGLKGRIIPTSSACTSGSQAIGYAFESIRHGLQTVMLAGGAEELCPSEAIAFDMLYATSRMNDSPSGTPRPYDRDRDGLVIGEGSGMLVLEELEHAKARGAKIHAEITGFATNSDGVHATEAGRRDDACRHGSRAARRRRSMPKAIGYINGHGTATEQGDIAESRATAGVAVRTCR